MSILDNLRVKATHQANAGWPIKRDSVCRPTGEIRPYVLDRNEQYELSATICVEFWANRAQYDDARRTAERALVHGMFHEVLAELHMLRLAISNSDPLAALAAADRVERALVGAA